MKVKYPFLDLRHANEPYMDELMAAAERVIKSGRYIGGTEIDAMEDDLAQLTSTKYAIGVSNGLDALKLIVRAYVEMGVFERGDEIIVPANTYIASLLAISDAGLVPVPVDVDIRSMNIDSRAAETAISPSTKGIMTVHLYGRMAWDSELMDMAGRHNLKIIEDCAQAIGGRATVAGINGTVEAGGLGDAAAFSFYPTKNIGALGDAGAVTTNDRVLADTVRALANYGSDRRYHNIYRGYNCRMDPLQGAMLAVKLRHTADENADRFARALAYHRTIRKDGVVTPEMSNAVTDNVWHQYVIRVLDGHRDQMRERLLDAGVETDIHYPTPPHLQPCYAGSLRHGPLPVTEQLSGEILSLPIGPGTSVKDAAEIAEILNNI
ncbi:DegT/DnrJ/EryC1/StrS aminotransferase family protein [uncultured Duncaniella sp.]|uniref:DegT/DnrJ/EryC1/StrS family aminotransferase n=1 Tax=uncultured Duncaniella sp. TaxID=2768039 RepID=UPI0026755362|nr:DegT/DnrJ/EryC1/StrS family aminotransferase [uncultured Duncaniella sp.]MCI9172168.1 DegT/DnrJ/EryC1/StrS family aminotransferase [Muribaculaceae bacterium]